MGFILKEHGKGKLVYSDDAANNDIFDDQNNTLTLSKSSFERYNNLTSKSFRKDYYCYRVTRNETEIIIEADYFIGLDWLAQGLRYIHIEPKINTTKELFFESALDIDDHSSEEIEKINISAEIQTSFPESYKELNYLKMLLDVMSDPKVSKETSDLVRINWEVPRISVNQQKDQLTPFLIIQFLQLLKSIIKKGLKKSYYRIQENLTNRIKGKVLVNKQIKQNLFKQRLTKTFCEYQSFGIDNQENKFLKKIFGFVISYIDNHPTLFKHNGLAIDEMVNYCNSSLNQVGDDLDEQAIKSFRYNPFFKEYAEAIKIGQFILRKFSYSMIKAKASLVESPPYWIDMPRLFELYVYHNLLRANRTKTSKIKYQFSTYGNSLDFLIKDGINSMVIDAKYKLRYRYGQVHEDMRQVAGYARLNKVLEELNKNNEGFDIDAVLPCVVIHPDAENGIDLSCEDISGLFLENLLSDKRKIKAYNRIFKIGIKLPFIADRSISF